jgi:arginine deiminase
MSRNITPLPDTFGTAAYGGDGWSQRTRSHRDEIGDLWTTCGIDNEWRQLKSVLVHRPGPEMLIPENQANEMQFVEAIDLGLVQAEHDQMVQAYKDQGISVHYTETGVTASPNQVYCADLLAMTPQGVILSRPASTVRAGEERWVAKTLGNLGIPIIKTFVGTATFEGADLMWLDAKTVVIGRGLRTNQEGIAQITQCLNSFDVEVYPFDMPYGTMHLMGMLRIIDKDLALIWPRRTPHALVEMLKERGFQVELIPDLQEANENKAFNSVTLGPRKIMMPGNNPNCRTFYESIGVEVILSPVDELKKANGAMGCMTGILQRETM